MTDPRDLIKRLADDLEGITEELVIPEYAHTEKERTDASLALIAEARAYLAQPEPEGLTDEELLALMPQSMRDEFSYAAKVSSDATGGQVRPGIFRVCLNHSALEYARAVHARTVLARRGGQPSTANHSANPTH